MKIIFYQKRNFLPMKFLLIGLILLLLPLSACQKQINYFDYVSELRRDIFLAEVDGFSLRIYNVVKETPYAPDGIPKERSARVETYLVPPDGSKTCHLTFTINQNTYGGEMSFDNVKSEYYYACTLDISSASEIPCRIEYGDKTLEITARSVRTADTLTPEHILHSLQETEADLFTSLTDKYGFMGEIYIRLLYEDAPYYYVGVIDRQSKTYAFLLHAKTGKVLAKRTS